MTTRTKVVGSRESGEILTQLDRAWWSAERAARWIPSGASESDRAEMLAALEAVKSAEMAARDTYKRLRF